MRFPLSIYLLALILVAVQPTVFGQTISPNQSTMIDSFGPVPNGDMRGRLDLFLATLANHPKSKGLVYVHGTPAQIAARTRLVQNHLGFRRFDASRVTFIGGRNVGYVRSDLWVVPPGAHEPDVKPEAWIEVEFGSVIASVGKRKIATFFADKKKACSNQVYIINYGSAKQIAQREMWFRNTRISCGYDGNRITLVNGGPGPIRTVMWLVPAGAENPTP